MAAALSTGTPFTSSVRPTFPPTWTATSTFTPEATRTPTPTATGTATPLPTATVTHTPTPRPTLPVGSDVIAFIKRTSGPVDDLYLFDVETGTQFNLSQWVDYEGAPHWSPDGIKIIFNDSNFRFKMIVTDGSYPPYDVFQDLRGVSGPDWSPDGTRIIFAQFVGSASHLFVVDQDGTNKVRLTNTERAYEYSPRWSPDGRYFLYLEESRETAITRIPFIVVADVACIEVPDSCGSLRRVGSGFDTVWSPDGQQIAYSSRVDNSPLNPQEIFIMNRDGNNIRQVTRFGKSGLSAQSGQSGAFMPTWSPDATRLAFIGREEGGISEIYLINVDGTNLRQLTNDTEASINYPAWRP